jgi:hypothetical protein
MPLVTARAWLSVAGTVAVAGIVAMAVAVSTALPSWACDPPYVVDEETGEFDQEAWDRGVAECADWVDEMEGRPSAADLAVQLAAGGIIVGFALWARPRRSEPREPLWSGNELLFRSWWLFVGLGGLLVVEGIAQLF